MYDDDDQEPVEELLAAQPTFSFPSQLFTDEDAEDNSSYVRGYN
jgi:hypothetical protein